LHHTASNLSIRFFYKHWAGQSGTSIEYNRYIIIKIYKNLFIINLYSRLQGPFVQILPTPKPHGNTEIRFDYNILECKYLENRYR